MAQYMRDIRISNVAIGEDLIVQLSEVFESRHKPLIETAQSTQDDEKIPYISYILRFDNKGYRLFSIEELLHFYKRAKNVERLVITVETLTSIKSSRLVGDYLELRLDRLDENNCMLVVSSDDSDWVDASYSAVREVLNKSNTRHGWARSMWSALGVQLFGVASGFVLSLWAASSISEKLTIDNSFVITFLFAFLLFSSAWTYINHGTLRFVSRVFPNIQFSRSGKDRLAWLAQALIGGMAAAFAIYLLGLVFSYIGDYVAGILK